MSTFALRLFGPPLVERDGKPVQGFESDKALALLGYLALQGRPVSRNHLANLFWCELSKERGLGNLRRVLHNLSSLLPGCLLIDRRSAQFDPAACQVDVITFETLTGRHDITSLQEAAQLCRGELMEGLSPEGCPEFELWLVAECERWNQRVIWVLDTLVTCHTRRGEYPHGLDDVGKLLALAPWWEKAHRQKMLLLARTGQCSAALRQYETCRRILVEDLSVEPTAETTALYERIRAAGERLPHRLPPQHTPFVGREDEWGVAALLNNLDGATYHHGEHEEAERLLEESLAICADIGVRQGTAHTLDNLGVVAETLAEFIEAKRRYQEALATLVSQLAPAVAAAVERAKARTLEEVSRA